MGAIMTNPAEPMHPDGHSHVFLGADHARNERKTWGVIALCSAMMILEIGGGSLFGSLALVADGLHMSTHATALAIAALAYTYARRRAADPRFTFGTGKFGDLAGFTSAIILAMIALLIGFEAVSRLLVPIHIDFDQAIPIAVLGLLVNIASAWLLSGGDHGHAHGHSHGHHSHAHEEEVRRIETPVGPMRLEVFEDGVPPRFRLSFEGSRNRDSTAGAITIETVRPNGERQRFAFADRGDYLESLEEIPEPHEFKAVLRLAGADRAWSHETAFTEHHDAHGAASRDNNMRAAFVHVAADAAVSVLAIIGLTTGRFFGWVWMDPTMGIVGALVIANWSYGLVRDTGGILLDMTTDQKIADRIRSAIETDGDRLADLHLWRLGPGHLGAILSVVTTEPRGAAFYHARLGEVGRFSHVTVEVRRREVAEVR
jgi:cation diffusion facilitator family transporter